jgi:predicted RNase H-like HicB family nuclease
MTDRFYVAIIERSSAGWLSVSFPDLPGMTSAGDTIEEATANAEEGLRSHLALTLESGEALPEARSVDEIERDPEVDEAARVLVRFRVPPLP